MTTYLMDFDFTSASQKAVLGELQRQGYSLMAYRGSSGPNQIGAGVPTWFAVPFGEMFGNVKIKYTPRYKVYVYNQFNVTVDTVIAMESSSAPTALGNALTFTPDGSFVGGGVATVPPDSIGLKNDRPAGTTAVTVGLAGEVDLPSGRGQYLPFCAFTLPPGGAIIMTPKDQILLVAAQKNLTSGNVQASVAAPGATFFFSASTIEYDLMVMPSTYGITNVPGTTAVTPVSSGDSIADIVNS